MSLAKNEGNKISEQDYLEGGKISEVRHEYIGGYVYVMAGGTDKHNTILGNFSRKIGNFLEEKKLPCKTFTESVKVKIKLTKKDKKKSDYFYPDVFVICDKHKEDNSYYKNSPIIIVEVLSDSTREYDLITKKFYYLGIPTLQEYVVIEQDICEVMVFRKSNDWKPDFYYLGNSITFESINVTLSVADIYFQVENENISDYLKKKEQEIEKVIQV